MTNAMEYGELRFAAGVYIPTATITLKNGIKLMGAYAVDGSGLHPK